MSVKRSGTDHCDLVAERVPRFRYPIGSNCHVYGLQILRYLQPGEELWITEGCSDCWAMLSSGRKAIAIPSATLLKDKDIEPLRGLNLHMFPDQDKPGEKLFLQLRERLPQIVRHQLPSGFKDYGAYYASLLSARSQCHGVPDTNQRSVCGGESGGASCFYQIAERFGSCNLAAEREVKSLK